MKRKKYPLAVIFRGDTSYKSLLLLATTGLILVVLQAGLAVLSTEFQYENPLSSMPISVAVGLEVAAGVVYLLALFVGRSVPEHVSLFGLVLVIGVLLRLVTFWTTPILEDDYYRYLWDGGVTASGINPYRTAPAEVGHPEASKGRYGASLDQLAQESGPIISRVNHPHLTTIYPPLAQLAFAVAHFIEPWKLWAWRLVLAIFDGITLVLLFGILRIIGKEEAIARARYQSNKKSIASGGFRSNWFPQERRGAGIILTGILIYWWNPLLITQTYSSVHMDLLTVPFVLGAIWLAAIARYNLSVVCLAAGAAVKIWPVLLLPLILRPLLRRPKQLAVALVLFGTLVAGFYVPLFSAVQNGSSGLLAYTQRWEMNDALFMVFVWGARLLPVTDWDWTAQEVARVLVVLVLSGWVLIQVWEAPGSLRRFGAVAMSIVAAAFLLSPTQFPWYYLWFLPLLALAPRFSLLLLTALLPLYYLRFYFDLKGMVEWFDYGIVWVEFLPVWALLIRETCIGRRRGAVENPSLKASGVTPPGAKSTA